MKKVTFVILGMGNRGMQCLRRHYKYQDEMEITAIADNRRVRLEAANRYLELPEDRLFDELMVEINRVIEEKGKA